MNVAMIGSGRIRATLARRFDRDRPVLFVAGDDDAAKADVIALADAIGCDAIDHGALAAGRSQQPGSSVFGTPLRLALTTRTG
jgi:predicted dinucleotide-binding enzyme